MKIKSQFTLDGVYIRDQDGRIVLFRGCNLGGDSKIPSSPPGNSLNSNVSFVGRPFPLDEADTHFSRLAGWGFTLLRFVITWEAVEHEGPGIYDEGYLSYLRDILKKAEAHGFSVFIDPHQDVWSRWTGGDGAPRWTLEAVGMDPDRMDETGAAYTMEGRGDAYKPMSWGLNYLRYAAATMNTLFFAGNTFAPGLFVQGVPIQDWLQDHFIDAMRHTARRIKDCASVIGFGIFNEPHYGFIGLPHVNGHGRITAPSGAAPSAFQAMASASGFTQRVGRFTLVGMLPSFGAEVFNPNGVSLFQEGYSCPWKGAGVWDVINGKPVIKKPTYFTAIPSGQTGEGTPVSFTDHFLKPFQKRFMHALSKKHAHYIFFAEGVPMGERISWSAEDRIRPDGKPLNIVDASHWYEGLTLLTKQWRAWLCADSETNKPVFGVSRVKKSIREQIARLAGRPRSEGTPAFLGEFGIPFDIGNKKSFSTGDYSKQEEALGIFYDGIDAAFLHSTIWNYSASNTNKEGDFWNTEDLSIYCSDTNSGRAVRGFSRPYALAISGTPIEMHFDSGTRVFIFSWEAEPGTTELYVPSHWYPEGWHIKIIPTESTVETSIEDQRVLVKTTSSGAMRIQIAPRS